MRLRSSRRALAGALILSAGLVIAGPRPALALTPTPLHVTKQQDTNDGACNADCSLREAVVAANAHAGPDVIVVPAGTYRLTRAGRGENHAMTGDLDLTDDVTIRGAGAASTIIMGLGKDRIFDVRGGATATIARLRMEGGNPGNASGGAIQIFGNATLRRVVIASNTANAGGGISDGGTLTIAGSLVENNMTVTGTTNPQGAGLFTTGPTTILASTFAGNTTTGAGSEGGGAIFTTDSSLTIRNSTLTGNTADFGGGIDTTNSSLVLDDDTIQGNSSTIAGGGGISHFSFNGSDHVSIGNTILAANSPENCTATANTIDSQGHNIDTGSSCGLAGTGDQSNTPAGLTPLAANGGPTPTEAIGIHSAALDQGASCEPKDQRGVPRPQGASCDVGAYETAVATVTKPVASTVHVETFTVAWNAAAAGSAAFDVRDRRRADGTTTFGAFHPFKKGTAAQTSPFTGAFGFEYCFSARAIDRGGHAGPFGPERCVDVTT